VSAAAVAIGRVALTNSRSPIRGGTRRGMGAGGGSAKREGNTKGKNNNCRASAYLIAERRPGLRRPSAEAGCWAIRGLAALSG
jgi:hypothetical protein